MDDIQNKKMENNIYLLRDCSLIAESSDFGSDDICTQMPIT